jgi:hypothetical protein
VWYEVHDVRRLQEVLHGFDEGMYDEKTYQWVDCAGSGFGRRQDSPEGSCRESDSDWSICVINYDQWYGWAEDWPGVLAYKIKEALDNKFKPNDTMLYVDLRRDLDTIVMRKNDDPVGLFEQIIASKNR